MEELDQVNQLLRKFNSLVNQKKCSQFESQEKLKVGIDLGTSSIVLTVLDQLDQPVYGSFEYADVVRDGLVVNYSAALQIVKRLKAEAEAVLGVSLTTAAGAIPPGTVGRNQEVVGNIIEAADMTVTQLIDEPTAASNLLKIRNGAVVDVGGGTTGISIFKDGRVVHLEDQSTGGHHMSLVLAGHYRLSLAEAEQLKRSEECDRTCFPVIKPVVEKMAEITRQSLSRYPSDCLYLVGGATLFKEFAPTFSTYLKQTVKQPIFPQFVTPIGIAMGA